MATRVQMEKISAGDYRGPAVLSFFFESSKGMTADQGSIDRRYRGLLSETLQSGQFRGERFESYPISLHGQRGVKRLLLVGLGKSEDFSLRDLRRAAALGVQALRANGIGEIALTFIDPEEKRFSLQVQAEVLTEGAIQGGYSFNPYRTEKKDRPAELETLILLAKDLPPIPIRDGMKWGEIVGSSVNYARTLGNHPANIATPEFLAGEAVEMAKRFPAMRCRILEREDAARLGMGAFLAVNQASEGYRPLKLIQIELRGRAAQGGRGRGGARTRGGRLPKIGLIGKAITFDSGGLNLKSTQYISYMKYDMCGGAAVLGAMRGLAEANLPVDVVAMIPATENMPGKTACRPGDVVKTLSGKTVEIGNTDAEGRLILCDTLTYMQQQKVDAIVDFATLTGAIVIALGPEANGLFCNHDALAAQVTAAGEHSGERVWRFPLWPEYHEKLKSEVADMNNIGGPNGGAITAACFLQKFVEDSVAWAHIDIAGTSHIEERKPGRPPGATGVGVGLALELLRKYKAV